MREQDLLKDDDALNLLTKAAEKHTAGVMTHVSRGKWHLTKIEVTAASPQYVHLEIAHREKHHPINIQIDQPVGLSFKHDFSKYIFESSVTGFEASVNAESGGIVVIGTPERIERLQRRNYYRVIVPKGLTVEALFWHRGYSDDSKQAPIDDYWKGRLIDVSAGGLQVAIELSQRPNFRQGQLVGIQFTPMPYEKPILLECQIRHIAPTADGQKLCLGMQIIGLEATAEGHDTLRRLCGVVRAYFEMNDKSGLRQPDGALAVMP